MNKTKKNLAFFLLISSIILPILPIITVAQDEEVVYRVSASALPDDWDPVVTDWYNVIWGWYGATATEEPILYPASYNPVGSVPNYDQWIGGLVTDWDLEFWPEQINDAGFINTGGVKSITFTLRENVSFHDGSDWNATVFKWNIDRSNLISGNYTGQSQTTEDNTAEGNLMNTILVEDWKRYFSAGWNMSKFDAPYLGIVPPTPGNEPTPNDYAYYNLGPNWTLVDYPGVTNIEPNGTVRNPAPYGGWDYAAGAPIHFAPYDRYPIVNYVEILENPQSGGMIKVHYNHWVVGGLSGWVNNPQISYHAYKNNHTYRGIYGYENGVADPRNAEPVTHMIGTGPYIYVEHDETGTPAGGHMLKNENYWNKTGLENLGWFDVDRWEIINFPAGELGRDSQNTALLTHAIDYAFSSMYMPLDEDAVKANPNIRFEQATTTPYKTNIVLNSVNETWWAWPGMDSWRRTFYPDAGNKPAGGVPRPMRKAMSFAFNYDLMIHTVLDDMAIRGGGVLGEPSIYYNATVADTKATYDLDYAREILLTTETDPTVFNTSGPIVRYNGSIPGLPDYGQNTFGYLPINTHLLQGYFPNPDRYNYSKICADRGLTVSSTDLDWRYEADNDPIFVLNFYWDSAHEDVKSVLQTSLRNIGVALADKTGATNRVTTIIWDTVRIGHLTTFDGVHSLWSCGAWVMDEHLDHESPELNLFWAHSDPDKGRWRPPGAPVIESWHYWGNYGMNFDTDADYYIDRMWASEFNDRKLWINKLAEVEHTKIYPKMWLYEAKESWAMWEDWEAWLVPNRQGYLTGPFGAIAPAYLRYVGLPPVTTLIPGSPLFITLSVSALSALGIIYVIMRKKKLR